MKKRRPMFGENSTGNKDHENIKSTLVLSFKEKKKTLPPTKPKKKKQEKMSGSEKKGKLGGRKEEVNWKLKNNNSFVIPENF